MTDWPSPSGPQHPLAGIGFDATRFPDARSPPDGARLVRLLAQHRDGFDVHDGAAPRRARALPRLKHLPAEQRPAVGDFGWVTPHADEWHLVEILPRFSVLQRGAAGERYAVQTLAANIDLVVVVCGLDGDFNPRRIERYLGLIAGSGIAALVVLTKADHHPPAEVAQRLAEVRGLALGLDVLALNAKSPEAVQPVRERLGPGRTGVLLGSSGAGKSTLTNALVGLEVNATQEVRAHDSRGRHTTVHRQLVRVPGGGCLIDSPGLREIKLLGDEPIEAEVFNEIADLALRCRFRDCTHDCEPGCAVRAALASGDLAPARLASYAKLRAEQSAQQAMASGARKLDEKRGAKLLRAVLKTKGRK